MSDFALQPGRRPSHWTRGLILTAGLACILSTGVLYGHFSQRWGPPVDLQAAGEDLAGLPRTLGPWRLAEELPIDDSALSLLQCSGYVNRKYINQESGQTINLALIVGPAGPTAVHTPEICFSSRAYQIQGQRSRVVVPTADGNEHIFWRVNFNSENVMADDLRVYYAWSLGERWDAATSPRFRFAAAPLLFKIQVAALVGPDIGEDAIDPCQDFLSALASSGWEMRRDAAERQ